MTPERWQEVKKLLAGALERPPEQQPVYLDQACTDPELRHQVESLITAYEGGDTSFIAQLTPRADPLPSGTKLGPYTILERLGAGGMGVVYRARDERLERQVAIKVLPPGLLMDRSARGQFHKEALALAKLSHPNIAVIHDVGEQEDMDFLVMECVPGCSVAEKLKAGPLPENEVLSLAAQIAAALEEAHEHGIVHRDLKPANVIVTPKGQAKVLDFGLAKLLRPISEATTQSLAQTRGIAGTLPYMAPEQLRGEPVDARTDIYALGAVLYEMAVGRRAFREDAVPRLTDAILHQPPAAPRIINPRISTNLERIIERCLAKTPQGRYASASELQRELEALQPRPVAWTWKAALRPRVVAATLLVTLLLAGVFGYRSYVRASRARWAEKVALPKIEQLISTNRPFEALRLLREAEPYARLSPEMARAQEVLGTPPISIETTPPGAEIYVRDYNDTPDAKDSSGWVLIGASPLRTTQLPGLGHYRIRAVKNGYEPVEWSIVGVMDKAVNLPLHPSDATPAGMVWVPAGFSPPPTQSVVPSAFWMDKYEVTNREFKKFVDSGGYQNREYWKEPFVQHGRTLSWEKAMARFRDATGRPGPSTWQLGTYPEGTADFPVGGVSWYEAMAYARFVGKSLPTVYHWFRAADFGIYSDILSLSNFDGRGPRTVGSYSGLGPFGTYDMAGNVKEWVLNADPAGDRRYILGGAWNEPRYQYSAADARDPFDRRATFGFRCVKYDSSVSKTLTGPFQLGAQGGTRPRPVDEKIFQVYLRLHSYDKTDLQPSVETVDDSSPYWRKEKVTFQAAYGDEHERVIARLYVPKGFAPPYQVAVYFPGSDALTARSPEELQDDEFEFVVRSGRALLFPSYKGTLERGPGAFYNLLGQPNKWTEMNLQWSKDLGRSLDYLETRQDINNEKVAFCGLSLGAEIAPYLIAVEPRIKTAVLVSGGAPAPPPAGMQPAEVDPWNYAPHVKIPLLMLNGRDDLLFPVETSQIPLLQALGTPAKDKQHVLFAGGHANLMSRPELMKVVLDWLDKYLGPVDSHPQTKRP